jgi:hypothetical protein
MLQFYDEKIAEERIQASAPNLHRGLTRAVENFSISDFPMHQQKTIQRNNDVFQRFCSGISPDASSMAPGIRR